MTLVDALAANNTELQALNKKINDLAGDLDKAAAAIQTVSTAVGKVAAAVAALV